MENKINEYLEVENDLNTIYSSAKKAALLAQDLNEDFFLRNNTQQDILYSFDRFSLMAQMIDDYIHEIKKTTEELSKKYYQLELSEVKAG